MRKAFALSTYPFKKTYIGNFTRDQTFFIKKYSGILDIDNWDSAPLDWGHGVIPFVLYKNNQFECWGYCYTPLVGYFTKYDSDDYQLVFQCTPVSHTYEFFDFEEINTTEQIILKAKEEDYESLMDAVEIYVQSHFQFDAIFFTYDDIKNFCYELKEKGIIEE